MAPLNTETHADTQAALHMRTRYGVGRHPLCTGAILKLCRYPVRAATRHPVQEHWRVTLFRQLLQAGQLNDSAAACLGELMYQSHVSYG